jgi:hypothetical protein
MLKLTKLSKLPLRTSLLLGVVLVALVVGVFALTHHKTTTIVPSTNPLADSTSGMPVPSSSPTNQNSSTSNSSANSSTQTGPPPAIPYGNFVSNHHPGGSAPTSEASTCNTSVGATCYIEFTKGSEVKKLDPETTDARGAAIWYWDVDTAGLNTGSWTVTAVATLNGQTKTANDAQPLVVQ